jgi:glycolate oxidase iron-sulfur subunit
MDSPRGRIYLMKGLAEGQLKLDDDVVRHLDLCLGCRGCETACPSGVHYGRLLERARGYVEENHPRRLGDALRRAAIRAIFPYPARVRAMLWPLLVADRLKLRGVLIRLMPRGLRDWIALVPDTACPPALRPEPSAPAADGPLALVHHGCVAQVLTPSENLNTERALAEAGYRLARLDKTVCCGALDLHDGNFARGL